MSTHGKIRFSCRLVRLRDAMTGSRSASHVAHCADCQAYYRSADSIVDQLRATAPRQTQAVPDELATRIARAVRQSTPAPRHRSHVPDAFAALAGAAAVLAFAVYLVRQNPKTTPTGQKTEIVATARTSDVSMLAAGVDSLRARLLDSVEPAAETLATQNPLSQEIASVQADARTALDFLVLNFLPAESARQLESHIDSTRS